MANATISPLFIYQEIVSHIREMILWFSKQLQSLCVCFIHQNAQVEADLLIAMCHALDPLLEVVN